MDYQLKYIKPTDLIGRKAIFSMKRLFVGFLGGNHTYALILEEAWFWQHQAAERGETEFNMSLKAEHGGPCWQDYYVTQGQLDGFRSLLEPYGILRSRAGYFRGRKTTFFSLDLQALDEAIGKYKLDGKPIARTMTIANWRVWRRELAARHPRTKERILLPAIAYAAVSGTSNTAIAPTSPKSRITIKSKSKPKSTRSPKSTSSSCTAIAEPEAPIAIAEPIAPPIAAPTPAAPAPDPGEDTSAITAEAWFDLPEIAKTEMRMQARSRFPGLPHIEGRILGYSDILGTSRDRRRFPDEIEAIALDHLANTSMRATATIGDARNWIVRACTNLTSPDRNLFFQGCDRLSQLADVYRQKQQRQTAIATDRAEQQAAIAQQQDRRHDPREYSRDYSWNVKREDYLLNKAGATKLSDAELVERDDLWNETWKQNAHIRLTDPAFIPRVAGEPLVGSSHNGQPITMDFYLAANQSDRALLRQAKPYRPLADLIDNEFPF